MDPLCMRCHDHFVNWAQAVYKDSDGITIDYKMRKDKMGGFNI